MKKQYTLTFNQYSPVSVDRSYLFTQYEAISNFIKSNCRSEQHNLILQPIKRNSEVDFWSEDESDYTPINELDANQRTELLKQYNASMFEMEKFAKELMNGEGADDFKWGTILLKVFDSNSHILLSDGKKFKLIWGWQFMNKSIYALPLAEFSHLLLPEFLPDDMKPTEPAIQEEVNEPPVIMVVPDNNVPSDIESANDGKDEELKSDPVAENPKKKRPIIPPTSNGFTQFLDGMERFGKKYWWLLLILLILLLLFLFRACNGKKDLSASEMDPKEMNKIYHEIMPPNPRERVRPINPGDIIDDDGSKSKVVGNVLNIALKNKTADFQHFSVDLKSAFPGNDYQIVYFDKETRRLQFEFPMAERQGMKEKIKQNLSNYDMLIWDEAVFNSMKTFNDPSFQDNQKIMPWKVINVPQAWDITTGDTSVIIAVIDDGFDLKHIEFKNRVYKPYNVINDTKKVSFDSNHKHGTHVAGIVSAAGNNGIGITGIAPQCRIMPIQASGPHEGFYMTDVVDGILYAIKNNADVINLSLGKMFTDDILNLSIDGQQNLINQNGKDEADFWNELFQMAEDNKVTIVIAAGNQDVIVGMDPMQRSDKVIKIAACNNSKQKADFSNYFKTLSNNGSCLSAPGVSIFSTLPENQYDYMDGTSMASPMVAGVVGLMKSANKNLTNKQIMRILFDTGFNTSNQKIGPLIQADKAVKKAKLMH